MRQTTRRVTPSMRRSMLAPVSTKTKTKTKTKKKTKKAPTTKRLSLDEHQALVAWAAACAEHVLFVFEDRWPDDARPREAIEAAWAWSRSEIPMMAARCFAFAAHDAARDVDGHARNAARAAGHAFATAHMPAHAEVAARYARAAVDDDSAEQDWQRSMEPKARARRDGRG